MTVRKILTDKLHMAKVLMMSLMLMLTVLQSCCTTYAYAGSHNTKTGYDLIIDDSAGYFSEGEIASLKELMGQITQYCNVALLTTTSHSYSSTFNYAEAYFDDAFGPSADGTIFVIDRDLNEIYLYSDGNAHKTITNSRAYSITDNTYVYATSDHDYDYYTCAYKTFEHQHLIEIGRNLGLLQGSEIPEIDFVPLRGDFARGIFASVYTRCDLSEEEALELYRNYYRDAAFCFVSAAPVDLKQAVNTNKCLISLTKKGNKLIISSVIDNLLKGASGQAVQNMNLMFGLDEKTGLKLKASAF